MQFTGPFDDHAAEIIVAGDFVALAVAGHHIGAGLCYLVQKREPALLGFKMLSRPSADKPARSFPKTDDPFLGDEPVDQCERVGGVRQDVPGTCRFNLGSPAGEVLADIDPAADGTAIAGTGPKAELICFEDNAVNAVLGQLE